MSTLYDFKVTTIDGQTTTLEAFKGRVLLIVNTASKCGFTPQFEGLEALYKKYGSEHFSILGFPCNQFGGQDPGSNDQIVSFCQANYGVSFPMFAKVDVSGTLAAPLFEYLKHAAPGVFGSESIKWNFTKFLIDHNGQVVNRYAPMTKPSDIEDDVIDLIEKISN
jgi:glutathione peroxidase